MNLSAPSLWYTTNFQYLLTEIERVRQVLKEHVNRQQNQPTQAKLDKELALKTADAVLNLPSALEQLCAFFGLSDFERDILLLCAAIELDPGFGPLCAAAQGDEEQNYPTIWLALSTFPQSYWSILSSQTPLRSWKLIEIGQGQTLTQSPLRIDKRILCFLLGEACLDDKLVGIVKLIDTASESNTLLPPSHQVLVEDLVANCFQASQPHGFTVAQLCGTDVAAKHAIAAAACASTGCNLKAMSASVLPANPHELYHLRQLWNREAILTKSALLLECDEVTQTDTVHETTISQFVQDISSPLIVSRQERQSYPDQRPLITFDIPQLTHGDQLAIWQTQLGSLAAESNGHVEALVSQFNLKTAAITAVCSSVKSKEPGRSAVGSSSEANFNRLWDVCRTMARPRLDDLAQRIDAKATWNDLVLPEQQQKNLHEIATHVKHRYQVYWKWGFAGKGNRGLGISVLFEGYSGTGKTTAAEVLAKELRLDLYRIDLSTVVSKYIGETEKNLRRIFDAAEAGGIVLLFDEADAIFGKRTEVKDSHDRHANVEVSYLLQRIEAYQGLAILTTNLKSSLDQAFLRRLRFVVSFPFPDPRTRVQLWQRMFPKQTPTQELDFNKLAKMNLAGGDIRNIALNATFKAAQTGEAVMMKHLLSAAQSEYIKLGRTLTTTETKDWVQE